MENLYFHKELFTHFFSWLLGKYKPSGLNEKLFEDPRDFKIGIFGWGEYKGKYRFKLIPTRRVINQGSFNTCQWCASTVIKEVDEKCDLAENSIVTKGLTLGMITGNGFSNLDSGDNVMRDWGIVEANKIDNDYSSYDWRAYTGKNIMIDKFKDNAGMHKIASYWQCKKRGDILKLLDDGKMLKTAFPWYSGFNQSGGFKAPWIISKAVGYFNGYHCVAKKGYIFGYKGIDANKKLIIGPGGSDVFVYQNSYGENWGATVIDDQGLTHKGLFFVTMDFFDKVGWDCIANLDMPLDVAKLIIQYNNLNVKCNESPQIFLIQNGTKRQYLTPGALAKSASDCLIVSKTVLDNVPYGPSIS